MVADSGDSWSSVVPCFLCSLGSGRSAVTLEGSAWLAREQGRVMPSGRGAPSRGLGAASVKPAGRRSQGGAEERHGTGLMAGSWSPRPQAAPARGPLGPAHLGRARRARCLLCVLGLEGRGRGLVQRLSAHAPSAPQRRVGAPGRARPPMGVGNWWRGGSRGGAVYGLVGPGGGGPAHALKERRRGRGGAVSRCRRQSRS